MTNGGGRLSLLLLSFIYPLVTLATGAAEQSSQDPAGVRSPEAYVDVSWFVSAGNVRNTVEPHAQAIQRALDAVPDTGGTVVFPPMTYVIDKPHGLSIRSNMTLQMYGARFVCAENMVEDGQIFRGENVHNVHFLGGSIIGKRGAWKPETNIAGIRFFGESSGVRIDDMRFEDLSSNAIGLFGADEEHRITDVRVRDVTVRNCCNYYGDYLDVDKGPAKGSAREDQGGIAFYFVDDWVVEGCCFEGSQSDGTHFFHSRQGRFVNNRVLKSKMGGYFLEGCEHVLASGNLISENGSRGVTIERDSLFCTLENCIVEYSGREGLWAPDIAACLVTGNIFRENGRKDDADKDSEIRIDNTEEFETWTHDIRILDNLFYLTPSQGSAIQVTADVSQIDIRNNAFRGSAEIQHITVAPQTEGIIVQDNDIAVAHSPK